MTGLTELRDDYPHERGSDRETAADWQTLRAIQEPVWCDHRVHNWHNYIGDLVREIWHEFTPYQRAVLALGAEHRAMNEEWD